MQHSEQQKISVEAAARQLRYQFFARLLSENHCDAVATAHTLDDQAETVLMRAVRGAGTRGLAGIYPKVRVGTGSPAEAGKNPDGLVAGAKFIVRPLLGVRRARVEKYLKDLGQEWREDGSNRDLRFSRNRVRHGLMPRLARHLNPGVRESLAELAEVCRAEEEYWCGETARVLTGVSEEEALLVSRLESLPLALARRVIRAWATEVGLRLEFGHVEEVRRVAQGECLAAALPEDWSARRIGGRLVLSSEGARMVTEYQYALSVPGKAVVPELGAEMTAELVGANQNGWQAVEAANAALLAGTLEVRNWRPGDRFLPRHSRGMKKVKELLQEKRVVGAERRLWPVVVHGGTIVWMRGFGVAEGFRLGDRGGQGVVFREDKFSERQPCPGDAHRPKNPGTREDVGVE